MSASNDARSAGTQQTAQPRSRRRFLTGVGTGGFLGSLLAGRSTQAGAYSIIRTFQCDK